MRRIELDSELVITQYYAFRSCAEVARLYGCSDQTIYRLLQREGIPATGWKQKKRIPTYRITPIDDRERERIVSEYMRCRNIEKVARDTHHAQSTISRIVWSAGVIECEDKCLYCGRPLNTKRRTQKFCSRTCRNSANPGDDRKRCRRYGVYYDPDVKREQVFERDGYICQICGIKCDINDLGWGSNGATHPTIDHIIPLSKGGTHTWDNVQCACGLCNSRKQDSI